jgi:signal transduction histidine kinase/ActR/RegA family two-component response regulator
LTPHLSERALILAPQGRDSEVAAAMLSEAGFISRPCRSLAQMIGEMEIGAGFGLITEEALRTADQHALSAWLNAQPEWSDFPFILLTVRGGGLERNPAAGRHLKTLGNVTFLERPFHPTTLISLAESARRSRQRQYQARARLEELHALASDLEQRVEQRTAERQLAIEQLHEAQKLETLGQLTGGVAHDFNNLLTPIIGTLDLLQRRIGTQDERTSRSITNALQSGERAKTLVQRLLGFARRQELTSSPTDIGALMAGMRDLIASSIGSTIELRVDCGEALPQAVADPNQLELAVLNLCVNARDAMPDGGSLTISVDSATLGPDTDTQLPPGDYVRLSIADTGTGMDAETLARAIEPFFSTKEVGRGTGLGLSMVHGLTAQLGGAFVLNSAPGQGTRADLYLPRAVGEVRAEAAAVAPALIPLKTRTILLVDDERLVRKGTAEMLRSLGHNVVEAEGGADALSELLGSPDIDLVVTDFKMPRMDGAELARRVHVARPNMPILLISGYTGGTVPAMDVIRLDKPFGLNELSHALHRACDSTEDPASLTGTTGASRAV